MLWQSITSLLIIWAMHVPVGTVGYLSLILPTAYSHAGQQVLWSCPAKSVSGPSSHAHQWKQWLGREVPCSPPQPPGLTPPRPHTSPHLQVHMGLPPSYGLRKAPNMRFHERLEGPVCVCVKYFSYEGSFNEN